LSNEGNDVVQTLKKITMKEVVYTSDEAWNMVRSSTIQKSWRKLLNITEN
jgi:hypothetical protein